MKIRRPVNVQEVAKLVELGRAMHAESTFAGMDFDPLVAGETLLRLMENPNGLVLMAHENDEPIGGIAAVIVQSFFGKDRVSSEFALYVRPDKRGWRTASELVEHYKTWAKIRGVKRVNAGNAAGMNDEVYVRFMSKLGFKRAGSLMYMGA